MATETLRRAAVLMRERAKTAPLGPWRPTAGAVWAMGEHHEFPVTKGTFWPDHIASWHPAVALAVADWLDEAAEEDDMGELELDKDPDHPALAVARAYLGET